MLLTILFVKAALIYATSADNSSDGDGSKFPPDGYNPHVADSRVLPVAVDLSVWLESVHKVDLTTMEFHVYGYVVQEWTDSRLANGNDREVLFLNDESLIWRPDIYCLNCHQTTLGKSNQEQSLLRVNGNGRVYFSQVIKLATSCDMDLSSFPFDKQVCNLELGSYGFNDSFIKYRWLKDVEIYQATVPEYLTKYRGQTEKIVRHQSGDYTVMVAEFLFTRRMGFFVIQSFLPMIILVMLSWITFYLEPSDVGNRLMIGVTLILTMMFISSNANLPNVSYIKAVDIYSIAAMIAISLTVFESVITYYLLFRAWKSAKNGVKEKTKRVSYGRKTCCFVFGRRHKRHPGHTKHALLAANGNGHEEMISGKSWQIPINSSTPMRSQSEPGARPHPMKTLDTVEDNRSDHSAEVGDGPGPGFQSRKVQKIDMIARILFPLAWIIFSTAFLIMFQGDVQRKFKGVLSDVERL